MDKPRYTHDCSTCTFLGQYNKYDLYYCKQSDIIPTLITRYSDSHNGYNSGLLFGISDVPQFQEALIRSLSIKRCKEEILKFFNTNGGDTLKRFNTFLKLAQIKE